MTATETNLFDEPTLRVYRKDNQGRWVCVYAKHISYIAIPIIHNPDRNNWQWNGTELTPF